MRDSLRARHPRRFSSPLTYRADVSTTGPWNSVRGGEKETDEGRKRRTRGERDGRGEKETDEGYRGFEPFRNNCRNNYFPGSLPFLRANV